MPGMLAGMAGAPGGGSTRSVTSAPAMTPPRALETLPPTVAVWADAPAAISRMAAQVAARQTLLIAFTSSQGPLASSDWKMTARIVERGQPTTPTPYRILRDGHFVVTDAVTDPGLTA